ncbi:cation diffusion facilitator family transporter [Nitrosophilus alvini]|uniref:cation diffusion facilitator family transporter n=1 Tax=Nitrosophilus alvini TaxID=2714855 RepID=UPI00190DA03F|nr:cation diffusion facilitator family transporter [Nitrosophilus alvini]
MFVKQRGGRCDMGDIKRKRRVIFWVLIFNLAIVISEIFAGVVSNSLALLSDAFHNASDMFSLVIAYIAILFSQKLPTKRLTYGYIKIESIAGFVNALFLLLMMIYIAFEAVLKFITPEKSDAVWMIWVALIAFVANVLSALFLNSIRENRENDVNIKAATLHMVSDAAISLGVVLGGAAIYIWNIHWMDPALSLLFSFFIGMEAFKVIKKAFFQILDSNPADMDKIVSVIKSFKNVEDVHDVHIWEPGRGEVYLTAHFVYKEDTSFKNIDELVKKMEEKLKSEGITHAVLQPELKACKMGGSVIHRS